MIKNENTKSIRKKKPLITRLDSNKVITLILILVTVGATITIASVVFFQDNQDGFSELSLLMYDSTSGTYIADNFPERLNQFSNVTVFFVVKNYENLVTYYQVQIKVTQIDQVVSSDYPLPTTQSGQLYNNKTFEKILSPANSKEKNEEAEFTDHYVWGPVNTTLYLNLSLISAFGGGISLKMVFELWKFDPQAENFYYSGVFNFLEIPHY